MIIPSKKILTRRNILRGMFAAPAIIAIDNLMPVKAYSFINPDPNVVLYKGIQKLDHAIFYCPYIPLERTWVTANSRKIGAEWTIELQQPLVSHISEEAVEILTKMLEEQKPL